MPWPHLRGLGALEGEPLTDSVAAVSVGFNGDGVALLDLTYDEDSPQAPT